MLRLAGVGSVVVLALLAWSCGEGSESSAAAATVTGAGGGTGGSTLVGGGPGFGCDPQCEAPQYCSASGVCLDEGTCAHEADCTGGLTCDIDAGECVPGGGCGELVATVDPIPPNLLIVLDRSCSMQDSVMGDTKWEIAVAAINQMTVDNEAKILFGLSLFPDIVTPSCQQDTIVIPPDAGKEDDIQALLTASLATADPYYPNGPCVTNIDTAMQQAAAEPALQDPDRPSYVLLITDGKQAGCSAAGGDAGTLTIIGDLYTNEGVPTFVLGFGFGSDPTQMNEFADAGGVPTGDPTTHFYDTQDAASLQAALEAIAAATLSCSFALEEQPEDPSEIYVFFDDDTAGVPNDGADGWQYDPDTNTITFYGVSCDQLKNGEVTDIDVIFGCEDPPTK